MKRLAAIPLLLAMLGCATFGIGGPQPKEQVVLEAAAALMIIEYLDLRGDDSLSKVDIAKALMAIGDETVQAAGYVSFAKLIEQRLNDVTDGKFHPDVFMMYTVTIAVLERLEEDAKSPVPLLIAAAI